MLASHRQPASRTFETNAARKNHGIPKLPLDSLARRELGCRPTVDPRFNPGSVLGAEVLDLHAVAVNVDAHVLSTYGCDALPLKEPCEANATLVFDAADFDAGLDEESSDFSVALVDDDLHR